ncbi:MAG: cell division protein ZapE [Woeseia sp.]
MTSATIKSAYASRPGVRPDAAQQAVVDQLADLQLRLYEARRPAQRLRRLLALRPRPAAVRGIYLWGDVGRGKTFVMDLFFNTLDIQHKKRIHFHRMMRDVHERMRNSGAVQDPLDAVAASIAAESTVVGIDEFYVSDIGDAMILGRLLDGLFRRGVTLIATSNIRPADLYAGGLQRARFLPAIELLEANVDVVELAGDVDYRLQLIQHAGTYITPAGDDATGRLRQFIAEAAPGREIRQRRLDINGRPVNARFAADGIAWFDFAELCDGPRSQDDYIEIARIYQTVIVSDVPPLGADNENAARRFIALVDEFYDRRVKLVVSAAEPPQRLYQGKRVRTEFARTESRLGEMQSAAYLHSAHRA